MIYFAIPMEIGKLIRDSKGRIIGNVISCSNRNDKGKYEVKISVDNEIFRNITRKVNSSCATINLKD